MEDFKTMPQEFIKNVFKAQIAILSTSLADQIVLKNNLSFAELINPFGKLMHEVFLRDHSGSSITVNDLRLSFQDLRQKEIIAKTNITTRILNDVISNSNDDPPYDTIKYKNQDIQVPVTIPWFEKYRETLFKIQGQSDHEFIRYFLACIILVSSEESNVLTAIENQTKNLLETQRSTHRRDKKFFSSNTLCYYVVLHDKSQETSFEIAEQTFNRVKEVYGDNRSFLLGINSRNSKTTEPKIVSDSWIPFINLYRRYGEHSTQTSNESPVDPINSPTTRNHNTQVTQVIQTTYDCDYQNKNQNDTVPYHPLLTPPVENEPSLFQDDFSEPDNNTSFNQIEYGAYLTSEDLEQINRFIQEFCTKALIPHVESEIQRIADVVANRKGVSRSLFHATKRWFVSSKPGSSTSTTPPKEYSSDDPEVQLRKLSDLYFIFGNYALAYHGYLMSKRDFYAESAWLYYAGASEMVAVAAFMNGEFVKKDYEYLEEAINCYRTPCRMRFLSNRATLLAVECLRGIGMWIELAKLLIRMADEGTDDLLSAVSLEMAAYCFLKLNMIKKFVLHSILAGNKYLKARQQKHSYRCYYLSSCIYTATDWNTARDHVHLILGRNATELKLPKEATKYYEKLIQSGTQYHPVQQLTFLRELLSCHSELSKNNENYCPTLPIPLLVENSMKIVLLPTAPLSAPERIPASSLILENCLRDTLVNQQFTTMEEFVVHEAFGHVPLTFKPTIMVHNVNTFVTHKPIGIAGESIAVLFQLSNPSKLVINLHNIRLRWNFTPTNSTEDVSDRNFVHFVPVPNVVVRADAIVEMTLYLTPLCPGELEIKGVLFGISPAINDEITSPIKIDFEAYIDFIFQNKFAKHKQTEQRLFIKVVPEAPCLQVTFSRIHHEVLTGEIQMVHVEMINVGNTGLTNVYFASFMPQLIFYDLELKEDINTDNMSVKEMHRKQFIKKINTIESLEPGQKYSFTMYIRAPDVKGTCVLDWMVYYQNLKELPKYRLVKHTWEFNVIESFILNVDSIMSEQYDPCNTKITISLSAKNAVHASYESTTSIEPQNAYLVAKLFELIQLPKQFNSRKPLDAGETREYFFSAIHRTATSSLTVSTNEINDRPKSPNLFIQKAIDYFVRNATKNKLIECTKDTQNDENSNLMLSKYESFGVIALSYFVNVIEPGDLHRTGYGLVIVPMKHTNGIPCYVEEDRNVLSPEPISFNKSNSALEESRQRHEMKETEKRQKRIQYICDIRSRIENDFDINEIVAVDFILVLHNKDDKWYNIKIDYLELSDSGDSRKIINTWLKNGEQVQHFHIAPNSSEKLHLCLGMLRTGIFDMSDFFTVYCSDYKKNLAVGQSVNDSQFTLQTCKYRNYFSVVHTKTIQH